MERIIGCRARTATKQPHYYYISSTNSTATPALPVPHSKREWVDYAAWRIREVLRTHIACSTKELEARISDFPPSRLQAPNPHHITTAKAMLIAQGTIAVEALENADFYTLATTDRTIARQVLERKSELHRGFTALTSENEKCGRNAEIITYKALAQSGTHGFPFAPGAGVTHLNGAETDRALDLAAYGQIYPYKLGIEVKNIREWIYPESWAVWKPIGSCVQLRAIPVLIARRIHHTSFRLFKRIGMIGHETETQAFAPTVNTHDRSILEQAREDFFFKDIAISDEPLPGQVDFFRTTVPMIAARSRNNFSRYAELLKKYAIEEDMWNQTMATPRRTQLLQNFREELDPPTPEQERSRE